MVYHRILSTHSFETSFSLSQQLVLDLVCVNEFIPISFSMPAAHSLICIYHNLTILLL